jgi:hypothetical protein
VAPGAAAFAQVRVRARHRFWRGPGVTHRFQVLAHPLGADAPVRADGTLLQEAVLPSWLPKAIALTAAAAVAAVALWFGVLRPAVRDAATNAGTAAAQKTVNLALQQSAAGGSPAQGGGAAGSSASPKASPGATPAPKASPGGTKAGGAKPTPTPSPAHTTGPASAPFALTLDAGNQAITPPAHHALALTDLVMQNPAGDQGTLSLSRGGQVLFSEQLADFRDYDLHFITAIMVTAGQTFRFSVTCTNPGGKACTPVVLLSGTNHTTS